MKGEGDVVEDVIDEAKGRTTGEGLNGTAAVRIKVLLLDDVLGIADRSDVWREGNNGIDREEGVTRESISDLVPSLTISQLSQRSSATTRATGTSSSSSSRLRALPATIVAAHSQ